MKDIVNLMLKISRKGSMLAVGQDPTGESSVVEGRRQSVNTRYVKRPEIMYGGTLSIPQRGSTSNLHRHFGVDHRSP